jgi:hypothetical protein
MCSKDRGGNWKVPSFERKFSNGFFAKMTHLDLSQFSVQCNALSKPNENSQGGSLCISPGTRVFPGQIDLFFTSL